MRSWYPLVLTLAVLAHSGLGWAQAPYLVKDINTTPDVSAATEPDDLTAATDALYFLGADYGNGFELRRYTGSGPVSFLVDFDPGPNGKTFRPPPAATGNRVFYFANSGLWITDGTPAGTVLLRRTDGTFNSFTERAIANGTLFFFADGAGGSQQLWKSDGTPAGTVPVASLYGGYLTTAGSRAFFVHDEPGTGAELWTSDGTTAGTHIVKDLCPGTCSGVADPDELEAVGDVLFFSGNDLTSGYDLFRSDGTAAGTVVVKDILPGPSGTFVSSLARFGSVLLFQATDGLWRSDGTAAGTYLLKPDVRFDVVYDAGGTAFFDGRESATGTELWKTDGTASGTLRVTDGCAGPCDFILNPVFSSVPGAVLFAEYEGQVLWRSDGTTAGTLPVGSFVSIGPSLARLGAETFFPADDGSHGRELWRTDGSPAGTTMVTDRADSSSFWRDLRTAGDRYFFQARRPDLGYEVWGSSGSEASTSVVDLAPGPGGTHVFSVGSLRSDLLFGAFPENLPAGFWKSDGTGGGTVRLLSIVTGPDFGENGEFAVFAAGFASNFMDVWRTDGTPGGTYPIDAPQLGPGSQPRAFARFGEEFVFATGSPSGLWRTDGTGEGTRQLYDGPCESVAVVDDRIFAVCYHLATGRELWISDGTALGTRLVKDINPGPGGAAIANLTSVEGALYFLSVDTLWRSDGTEAGTQPLHASTSVPMDLQADKLTVSNGILYFSGSIAATGSELWRTDGTPTGTFLVADLLPGPASGLFNVVPFGAGVLLSSATPSTGVELWSSDGTPGGITPLPEIAPGPASGSPDYFHHADGHTFFHATDGNTGYELWAVAEPSGTLAVGDVTLGEGDAGTTSGVFEVRVVSPSAAPVTVAYATVAGTAQAGTDFFPRSGVLTFAPGTQALTVEVPVVGDMQDEKDETFFLALSSVSGGVIADGRGTAIVRDDDSPRITVESASIVEGDSGTTDLVFDVGLITSDGSPTPEAKTVGFATESVTATVGMDFDATSGTLTFPAASPSGSALTVRVPVRGDTAEEPNELFHLRLSMHGDAVTPTAPAQGVILDDDGVGAAPPIELAHGSTLRATLQAPAGRLSDRDFYALRQQPRASYELVVDEVSGDAVPLEVRRMSGDGTTVLQSAQAIGAGPGRSLRWVNTTNALADQHIRVESTACGSSCDADDTYRVRMYETTLSAPRFNNLGGQATVVILQNPSSSTIAGDILLWVDSGTLVATSAFQLGPHATLVLNTSTLPTSGYAGSITVTHDGPYGSLVGKVVALEPATGFTFDTTMTYRPR